MYLSRIECHHFGPPQQSRGAKSRDRMSMGFEGVDTSFSHPRPCHGGEEAVRIERALASFHAAVAKDYGFEEAARSAADWIEELEKTGTDERLDWRSVTARAAHRLALRVVERHPYVEMSSS